MKIKIIILFCLFVATSHAQTSYQTYFSMKWNNYSLINPAATGIFNKHFASINGKQNGNLDQGPKTIGVLYDFKWKKINSGIGGNYIYDRFGFLNSNLYTINYSYHFDLGKNRLLGSGFSVGLLRKSVDLRDFSNYDPNDPFADPNPIIKSHYYNFNLGLVFKTPHLLVGLNALKLADSKLKEISSSSSSSSSAFKIHYYLLCSYNMDLGTHFNIKPGILVSSDLSNTNYELNLSTTYNKQIWAGITYREGTIAGMVGWDIKKKFRIGYAFERIKSKIMVKPFYTNELILGLMLD